MPNNDNADFSIIVTLRPSDAFKAEYGNMLRAIQDQNEAAKKNKAFTEMRSENFRIQKKRKGSNYLDCTIFDKSNNQKAKFQVDIKNANLNTHDILCNILAKFEIENLKHLKNQVNILGSKVKRIGINWPNSVVNINETKETEAGPRDNEFSLEKYAREGRDI